MFDLCLSTLGYVDFFFTNAYAYGMCMLMFANEIEIKNVLFDKRLLQQNLIYI